MRDCVRHSGHVAKAALFGVSLAALTAPAGAVEYKMTVNQDRLIHADREPQNWLMMNGDYGSTRYSKLSQINRDNVKNLHMVWALALRGMQDIGQNGPENEVNPLIDNGFMYTSDGWGTVYKIDARSGDHGEFVWIADPGVKHEGNIPRTRGIALWEDLVINNLPDGRVIAINRDSGEIVWDKQVAKAERVRHQGAHELGAAGCGRQGHRRQRRRRQRHPRLARRASTPGPATSCGAGTRSRSPASPAARPGRTRTTPGRPAAADCGRPAPTIPRPSSPSGAPATRSRNTIRHRARATTSTPTRWLRVDVNTGKLQWYFQYLPNNSWDYDEIGIHMLYDVNIGGEPRKVVSHFARNGFFYSLDRNNGSFVKGAQYVNDLNWTKGLDPKTGKPIEYDPKLDVQTYVAAARPMPGDPTKRSCPTWHGGVAYQPTAYNPVKQIAYGVGAEGCSSWNGSTAAFKGPDGGLDRAKFSKRTYTQRSLLRLDHRLRRGQPEGAGEGRDGHRESVPVRPSPPAACCSRPCRTAGSSPMTTRTCTSCGASTSARRSRARRWSSRSGRRSISRCRRADATCIR